MNEPQSRPCQGGIGTHPKPRPSSHKPSQWVGLAFITVGLVGVVTPGLVLAQTGAVESCPRTLLQAMGMPGSAEYALGQPAQHLAALAKWEPQCLLTADFYRIRAQLRLALGLHHSALEDTERALLLEPDHPGTQLDHARLLMAVGDSDSAYGLLAQLAARKDVPPHLLAGFSSLQQAFLDLEPGTDAFAPIHAEQAALVPLGVKGRWQFAQSWGRDSNINRAPGGGQLTLTLPTGDANFVLGESSLPQPSALFQTQLQWQGTRSSAQALWLAKAELQHRHTPIATHRATQANMGLTWLQNPLANKQWIWQTQASRSQWALQSSHTATRIGLQHQWQSWTCSPSLGLEAERRQYSSATLQNGQYAGAVLALACGPWQWQWRQGTDRPAQADRPGGPQAQQDVRLVWRGQSGAHGWVLEHRWQRQADGGGYSPLLANNAPRRIVRQELQAEWVVSVTGVPGPAPQAFVQLEWSRQSSNLVLFAFTHHRVQAGLRWTLE